jgi:U-box domain
LADPTTREDYLDSMLGVVQRMQDFPRHMQQQQTLLLSVQQAHVSWLQGYEAKQHTNENDRSRYFQAVAEQAAKNQQQQHFRLEGGLTSQQPKRMRINILREQRSIRLGCPFLRPAHVYSENVVSVSIMAVDDDNVGKKNRDHGLLYKLSGTGLTEALEEAKLGETETLTCVVKLPDWGIWSLYWHASVRNDENGGQVAQTCSSSIQEVDMTHPQILKAQHDLPILINSAKRHAGLVKAICGISSQQHALAGTTTLPATAGGGSSATSVEQTYWHMHQTMTKARSTALRLEECLDILYRDTKGETKKQQAAIVTPATTERTERYHVLQSLKSRLDDATAYKATLEERLAVLSQRDSLKQFKRLVGNLLESGEAAEWMTSVTPDQLCDMMSTNSNTKKSKAVVDKESSNTAVNRLYQLLVEGKKANSSLVLDANILTRASKRDDLFSAKQCETLLQRAEIAEQAQAAEREQLEHETRKEQQAEAARLLLQNRAKAMPCARNSWVQLQGLQKRPDLNGMSGVFMGIDTASTTERYCIRLYPSSNDNGSSTNGEGFREVSLLAKNFVPYDQLQARNLQQQHEQAQQQQAHNGVDDDCNDDDGEEPAMVSLLFPIPQGIENIFGNLDNNRPPQEPVLPQTTEGKSPASAQKSWQCSKCTFLHEGKLVTMTECDLCGAPREVTTAASSVSSSPLPLSGSVGSPSPPMNFTATSSRTGVTTPVRPHPPAVATITSATTTLWSPAPARPLAPIARPTPATATAQSQRVATTHQHHHLDNGHKSTSCVPVPAPAPNVAVRAVAAPSHVSPPLRHATPGQSAPASKPISGPSRGAPFEYPPSKIQPLSNRICKATVYIRNMDVALFIGQKGKHVKLVQTKTGINKLMADQKSCIDTKGGVVLCPVRIEGNNVDCVQKAVTMVEAFAMRQVPPYHNAHLSSSSSTSSTSPSSQSSPSTRLPISTTVPAETAAQRYSPQAFTAVKMPQPSLITSPPTASLGHAVEMTHHSVAVVASATPPAAPVPQQPVNPVVGSFIAPKVEHRPTMTIEALLREENGCFKCTPQAFSVWLQSMDVWSLEDLAEAMEDDEFIDDMQANGLKGFKRSAFKKAVAMTQQAATGPEPVATPPLPPQALPLVLSPLQQLQQQAPASWTATDQTANSATNGDHEIPNELICPISHNLLVNDPVCARDGYTYEREHIEAWFAMKGGKTGSVRSPMADMILDDLTLIPNASIKSMARNFARSNPNSL